MSQHNRQQQIFDDKNSTGDKGHFKRREDHETHTTALAFLVLTVVVVVGVALSLSGNGPARIGDYGLGDLDNQNQQSTTTNPETSGASVPVTDRQSTSTSNFSNLPADLPLRVETVDENTVGDFGEGFSRRVVEYQSTGSLDDLRTAYRQWVEGSQFATTEDQPSVSANTNSFTLRQGSDRLYVRLSTNPETNEPQVQLIYIYPA